MNSLLDGKNRLRSGGYPLPKSSSLLLGWLFFLDQLSRTLEDALTNGRERKLSLFIHCLFARDTKYVSSELLIVELSNDIVYYELCSFFVVRLAEHSI